ncbi:contractile injection system protein, VgrG/Pvc8 family [Xanthomonas oryzae pv. oryzicola]|uniref:contractile injection system protein, VgrG/Pvc8 family n=1 Tax=Xanthomonas oryzae TaxID=347 RepID=UPI000B2BDF9E|nr:phage late control D family protein [Xanthomonas oryzae]QEO97385.1 putative vgr-related protein [Xanthomonas oryzae pv. oryzicola]
MDLMQCVAISQDGRILELQFAGQNAPRRNLLFPLRLQLTGALSESFTADVTCLSQSSAIELKTLLGQRAGITIRHHGGERNVNGVVTAVRQLGADGGLSSYRLPIQPALALLAYRRTCRIFPAASSRRRACRTSSRRSCRNIAPAIPRSPPASAWTSSCASDVSPKLRTAMRTRKIM